MVLENTIKERETREGRVCSHAHQNRLGSSPVASPSTVNLSQINFSLELLAVSIHFNSKSLLYSLLDFLTSLLAFIYLFLFTCFYYCFSFLYGLSYIIIRRFISELILSDPTHLDTC